MAKMIALAKAKPAPGAQLVEAEIPKPAPGELLVKTKAVSICGTDVHIYNWDPWAQSRIKTPLIFGHEFAGEVVEIGPGTKTHVKTGDIVSGETHIYCGKCHLCKMGNQHICATVKLRGIDVQGCFAEYLTMPANTAWVNPKNLPIEHMSAQEPMGNAVHTVFEGGNVLGETVAIFGCGPIGSCAAAICRAAGAKHVFAIDISDYRLSLAKSMNGTADITTINSVREDPVKIIMEATGGHGVDAFLGMSGAAPVYRQGFAVLRPGGRAGLLGLPKEKTITFDVTNEIVFKQARVFGINGRRIWGTWETAAKLLSEGKVDLGKLVTHKFPMSKFAEAFETMKSGNSGKIVMYPGK